MQLSKDANSKKLFARETHEIYKKDLLLAYLAYFAGNKS